VGAALSGQDGGNTRARILLVDDDVDIRRSVGALLEDEGYEVASVGDGRLAWDRLRAEPAPDLLILDLMLPGMDGWQLRSRQQADPRIRDIPVLAISADGSPRAAAIDAAAFLAKPFTAEDLLREVKRILATRSPAMAATHLHQMHRLALLGMLTANIEHQLRNPLAFLLGNTRMACDALLDLQAGRMTALNSPVELAGMMGDARIGAERIHALVEAMGMMARARPDGERRACVETALQAVITLTSGHLRRRVRLAGASVSPVHVPMEEPLLVQVIVSLLLWQLDDGTQAAGSDVDIQMRCEAGQVVIEIRGHAPPARADDLESAIGLALCRSLVQPIGGHIGLHDVGPRNTEGSALVRLTLPITP
jgi:two-component system chemotaxis response regulator CheY